MLSGLDECVLLLVIVSDFDVGVNLLVLYKVDFVVLCKLLGVELVVLISNVFFLNSEYGLGGCILLVVVYVVMKVCFLKVLGCVWVDVYLGILGMFDMLGLKLVVGWMFDVDEYVFGKFFGQLVVVLVMIVMQVFV